MSIGTKHPVLKITDDADGELKCGQVDDYGEPILALVISFPDLGPVGHVELDMNRARKLRDYLNSWIVD
jgi:hypothetical protein